MPPRECVTPEQLEALEERIGVRIDDMKDTMRTLLAPVTASNKMSEACVKMGFETVQMALRPSTLVLLIILCALVIGGTPVAMAVVQGYMPKPPAANVQINSNNEAPDEASE